jgi:glycosyltransferase involved in cell wall biosynthesis
MKNRQALLLSCFMLRGYGVSVVAGELQRRLRHWGWDLHVGYLEADDFGRASSRLFIPADETEIFHYCIRNKIEIVIAQTSPYFEVLPQLASSIPVVCFEHGDPTPEFFREEMAVREESKKFKLEMVYPHVNEVWTISEFLRHDIGWMQARVIPNGADHVSRMRKRAIGYGDKIRVGFLARLGQLESEYKGNDVLLALAKRFGDEERIEFTVMGRGSVEDAELFEEQGISVALNASDAERDRFLENIDVFFSASRWEGFNLPLVEAQHAGCAAMAFDVGAHPETTPYVLNSIDEAETLLRHWLEDRDALREAGDRCQRFVDEKFSWDRTTELFASAIEDVILRGGSESSVYRRVRLLIRRYGVVGVVRRVIRKAMRR